MRATMSSQYTQEAHTLRHAVFAAIGSVFLLVPLTWMLFDRTPPYKFEQVEISPQVVPQGGEIYITFTATQNRASCGPGLVYREFREEASGKLHTFDPVMRAVSPTFDDDRKFTRIAKLPDNITPGLTTYRGIACYACNPIHSWLRWPVCVRTPEVAFTVVAKP